MLVMKQFEPGVRSLGNSMRSEISQRRPGVANKWHLDEMVVTINGEQYYLLRAVDADLTCSTF